jgi:hypothetical protein
MKRTPHVSDQVLQDATQALADVAKTDGDPHVRLRAAEILLGQAYVYDGLTEPQGVEAPQETDEPGIVFDGVTVDEKGVHVGVEPGGWSRMAKLSEPEPPTFNEHGNAMLRRIWHLLGDDLDRGVMTEDSIRDLELSREHLEDALTRYNSARYRMNGTWGRQDSDRVIWRDNEVKCRPRSSGGVRGEAYASTACSSCAERPL